MDKFGIFKLLNSFLGSNNSNAESETNQNSSTQADFSGLLSAFGNTNKPSTPPQKKEIKPAPPLQASMLSVMNSHDQFVKRVKEKHTSKTH